MALRVVDVESEGNGSEVEELGLRFGRVVEVLEGPEGDRGGVGDRNGLEDFGRRKFLAVESFGYLLAGLFESFLTKTFNLVKLKWKFNLKSKGRLKRSKKNKKTNSHYV